MDEGSAIKLGNPSGFPLLPKLDDRSREEDYDISETKQHVIGSKMPRVLGAEFWGFQL